MSEYRSQERTFDIEALAKSNWRSRINQFKREIRASHGRPPALSSIGPRRRSGKRQVSRFAPQEMVQSQV
jgi:hypothetical protein